MEQKRLGEGFSMRCSDKRCLDKVELAGEVTVCLDKLVSYSEKVGELLGSIVVGLLGRSSVSVINLLLRQMLGQRSETLGLGQ